MHSHHQTREEKQAKVLSIDVYWGGQYLSLSVYLFSLSLFPSYSSAGFITRNKINCTVRCDLRQQLSKKISFHFAPYFIEIRGWVNSEFHFHKCLWSLRLKSSYMDSWCQCTLLSLIWQQKVYLYMTLLKEQ